MKIKDIEIKHHKWFKGHQKSLCLSKLPQLQNVAIIYLGAQKYATIYFKRGSLSR